MNSTNIKRLIYITNQFGLINKEYEDIARQLINKDFIAELEMMGNNDNGEELQRLYVYSTRENIEYTGGCAVYKILRKLDNTEDVLDVIISTNEVNESDINNEEPNREQVCAMKHIEDTVVEDIEEDTIKNSTVDVAKSLDKDGEELLLRKLEDRMEQLRMEYRQKNIDKAYEYNPIPYSDNATALDLYPEGFLDTVRIRLKQTNRCLINDKAGIGKTYAIKYICEKLFNYNIEVKTSIKNRLEYKNVMFIEGNNCGELVGMPDNPGQLVRFINYIDENNITDDCVLIIDEVHVNKKMILSRIWNALATGLVGTEFEAYNRIVKWPPNLYLITTACLTHEYSPLDDQHVDRLSGNRGVVELKQLISEAGNTHYLEKIINVLGEHYNIEHECIEKLVNSIVRINTMLGYVQISMRYLIESLNNRDCNIILSNIYSEDRSKVELEINRIRRLKLWEG